MQLPHTDTGEHSGMVLIVAIAAVPFALIGLTALCACLGGCCCADREALAKMDVPAQADLA